MKIGDCVRVDYDGASDQAWDKSHWTGICTWSDGYKFEFLIDGKFDTWTSYDLEALGAEVVSSMLTDEQLEDVVGGMPPERFSLWRTEKLNENR